MIVFYINREGIFENAFTVDVKTITALRQIKICVIHFLYEGKESFLNRQYIII